MSLNGLARTHFKRTGVTSSEIFEVMMVWKITKFMLWSLYTLFFLYAFLHWAVLMLDEETNQFTVVLTDKFQGTSCEDC